MIWPLTEIPAIPTDFPLIAGVQSLLFVASVWVFFILHRRPSPVVQVLAITPFTILASVVARLFYPGYTGTTDLLWIPMVLLSYCSTIYYSIRSPQTYLEGKPDLLDSWRYRAVAASVIIVVALMVGYGVKLYGEWQQARQEKAQFYQQGYTKAVLEQTKRDSLLALKADSVKTALRKKDIQDSLWRVYVRDSFKQQIEGVSAVKQEVKRSQKPVRGVTIYVNTNATKPIVSKPIPFTREVKPLEDKPKSKDKPKKGRTAYDPDTQYETGMVEAIITTIGYPALDTSYFARGLRRKEP